MKTSVVSGPFEVHFDGDRYIGAAKTFLGPGSKVATEDNSNTLHMSSSWDAVFVLTDREMMHALFQGAAFAGGAIAAGALHEVGKSLYEKAKTLVFGCHAEHRKKCITIRQHDPDRHVDYIGLGTHVHFNDKGRARLNVAFRTFNLGEGNQLTDDKFDRDEMQRMMHAFETNIAPKVVHFLEKFPDAEIGIDLNTAGAGKPAGGGMFIEAGDLGPQIIRLSPTYSIQPSDANETKLRKLLAALETGSARGTNG